MSSREEALDDILYLRTSNEFVCASEMDFMMKAKVELKQLVYKLQKPWMKLKKLLDKFLQAIPKKSSTRRDENRQQQLIIWITGSKDIDIRLNIIWLRVSVNKYLC